MGAISLFRQSAPWRVWRPAHLTSKSPHYLEFGMDPQALFRPVSTRSHRIDSFGAFILNNVPYAEVRPQDVQWGAVQYDGPLAQGIDQQKPALQWHFGGVPYPITKAVRIFYTFKRTWDGSDAVVTASIFLGFQDNLTGLVLAQPIPYVGAPGPTFTIRTTTLGQFGNFSNQVWGSDSAILGSQASAVVTRAVFQADPAVPDTFDTFIQSELPPFYGFAQLTSNTIPIDFDGPAQNSDSHKVFQYTIATLSNDPEQYRQVLFWYFGAKPYRVTKAMRIPLDPESWQQGVGSFVRQAAERGVAARRTQLARQAGLVAAARAAAVEAARARAAAARTPGGDADKAEALLADAEGVAAEAAKAVRPQGHALFIGFGGNDPDSGG
jgi:hypothetical protein